MKAFDWLSSAKKNKDFFFKLTSLYWNKILISQHFFGSLKKQEFQENIYFCFIDYTKAFDCVDHNKLWKIL